jgi:hypothetical protein
LKLITILLAALASAPAYAINVSLGYQFPSTLTGAAVGVSGSISSGSNMLTVNDGSLFNVSDQIIIAGVSGTFAITAITGNNLTLHASAKSTVKGAAVRTVVGHVDHSSFVIFWMVDTPAYNSIEFGTSSGKYPYRTYEVNFPQSGLVHIAIGGLTPGTTYYLRPQAKPGPGDDSGLRGICNADACGANEITVTTAPDPAVHPQVPALPKRYTPVQPDTSSYKVIPVPRFADGKITGSIEAGKAVLTVNSTAGLVVGDWIVIAGTACTSFPAMAGVAQQFPGCKIKSLAGNSVTLNSPVGAAVHNAPVSWALYTIQDLLKPANPNHTGYGTVFEWAQGYKGIWYTVQESYGPLGLRAPDLPPDDNPRCSAHPCALSDPAHRWIVFRTAGGPRLLPPPGVRTGPSYAAALGAIVVQQGNPLLNGGEAMYFSDATYTTFAHHYLVQNLEFTTVATPADWTDPKPYATPIFASATVPAHVPQYLTLDRVYIHSPNKTTRMYISGVQWEGKNMAILGSYIGPVDLWRPYHPLDKPCVVAGNVLKIPPQTYQRNKLEKVWTLPAEVTAILNSSGYTGNFIVYLKPDGTLGISYDAPAAGTASLACVPNCTATQVPGKVAFLPEHYADAQGGYSSNGWPNNTVKVCSGTIANNTFTFYSPLFTDVTWATEGSVGISVNDGPGPYLFENNHIEGYGISFFVDSTGTLNPSPSDVTILRNLFYWNHDHISNNPASNGFFYHVRNLLELKRGQRWLIKGNIFDGAFARVNQGSSILFSARQIQGQNGSLTGGEGIADMTVQSNVIRNGSETTYCQGGSPGSDPPLTKRILYYNNLEYKMNAFLYQDHPPSTFIGYTLRFLLGCQDIAVRHNTFYNHVGPSPWQIVLGAQMWMEGLDISNNIFHLNSSSNGAGIATDGSAAVDLRTGHPTWPFLPAMDGSSYESALKTTSVRIGASVKPNVTFAGNLLVGGTVSSTTRILGDLTPSALGELRAKYGSFAAQNTFAVGATRAQREAWAGWGTGSPPSPSGSHYGFKLNSKSCCIAGATGQATDGHDVGADIDLLEQDRGAIYGVKAQSITSAGATIAFTAPDPGAACYAFYGTGSSADITSYKKSAANTSTTRDRSIALDGLAAHTAYNAVVACSGASDETVVAFSTP